MAINVGMDGAVAKATQAMKQRAVFESLNEQSESIARLDKAISDLEGRLDVARHVLPREQEQPPEMRVGSGLTNMISTRTGDINSLRVRVETLLNELEI